MLYITHPHLKLNSFRLDPRGMKLSSVLAPRGENWYYKDRADGLGRALLKSNSIRVERRARSVLPFAHVAQILTE